MITYCILGVICESAVIDKSPKGRPDSCPSRRAQLRWLPLQRYESGQDRSFAQGFFHHVRKLARLVTNERSDHLGPVARIYGPRFQHQNPASIDIAPPLRCPEAGYRVHQNLPLSACYILSRSHGPSNLHLLPPLGILEDTAGQVPQHLRQLHSRLRYQRSHGRCDPGASIIFSALLADVEDAKCQGCQYPGCWRTDNAYERLPHGVVIQRRPLGGLHRSQHQALPCRVRFLPLSLSSHAR
jgi:hypothetical protein